MSNANDRLQMPSDLKSLVFNKFRNAQESQSLILSDTQLVTLRSKAGLYFQLRYCAALSKKPSDDKNLSSSSRLSGPPKKRFDPFEDPTPDLLVARIPNPEHYTHNLVLNKFPVIANHFILATRDNKQQSHLLEPSDLEATYACLHAWDHNSHSLHNGLYAFFNSGQYSGASQPHRHIQLLSVQDMKSVQTSDSPQPNPPWVLLCDQMSTLAHPGLPLYHNPDLPFVHLSTPLSSTLSPSDLYQSYLLLLNAAYRVVGPVLATKPSPQVLTPVPVSSLDPTEFLPPIKSDSLISPSGDVVFSYNLAMTKSNMVVLPRRSDEATIPGFEQSSVSINGTIFAGTLMVKNEDEWQALKSQPQVLDDLLCQIGVPTNETHWVTSESRSKSKV